MSNSSDFKKFRTSSSILRQRVENFSRSFLRRISSSDNSSSPKMDSASICSSMYDSQFTTTENDDNSDGKQNLRTFYLNFKYSVTQNKLKIKLGRVRFMLTFCHFKLLCIYFSLYGCCCFIYL